MRVWNALVLDHVKCGGKHAATSKSCDSYKRKHKELALRATERLRFTEAKACVLVSSSPGVEMEAASDDLKKMRSKESLNDSPLTKVQTSIANEDSEKDLCSATWAVVMPKLLRDHGGLSGTPVSTSCSGVEESRSLDIQRTRSISPSDPPPGS
ncbi:hypothetical protein Pcinc_029962 [Petrolisthes cinctipes]|nr:hypothetical protein Pcinc_029962 [Petrolisthes cinctipes]